MGKCQKMVRTCAAFFRSQRLQLQRRSDVHDSIQPVRRFSILRGTAAEILAAFFQITKELFYSDRRRESDEHPALPDAVVHEGVWNTTWT